LLLFFIKKKKKATCRLQRLRKNVATGPLEFWFIPKKLKAFLMKKKMTLAQFYILFTKTIHNEKAT